MSFPDSSEMNREQFIHPLHSFWSPISAVIASCQPGSSESVLWWGVADPVGGAEQTPWTSSDVVKSTKFLQRILLGRSLGLQAHRGDGCLLALGFALL